MGKRYCSDEELIEIIKKYIQDDCYNRAILLDGAWGSGKTFFVKNKLINELDSKYNNVNRSIFRRKESKKNGKKVIYISLYGVESTLDITNEIYLELLKKAKSSRLNTISNLGGKFISDLIKNKGFDISKYIGECKKLIDISKCILIFDDLERCNCDISEILGYINDFVEHKDMKVILIANEEEIGGITKERAEFVERIKKSRGKKKEEEFNNITRNFNVNETSKELEKVKVKYEPGTLEKYLKIKEKLVGETIIYKPNLEESMKILIKEKVNNSRLKESLLGNIENFITIIEEQEHINLRTFQFFLSKISIIYEVVNETKHKNNDDYMKSLSVYALNVCIYHKKGIYMNEWQEGNLYGDIELEPYIMEKETRNLFTNNTIIGFRFVDDIVVYSKVVDVKMVERTLELYYEDFKERSFEDDPLNRLEIWYRLEDEDIKKYIKEIHVRIKEEKYSPKRFSHILLRYITMEESGVDFGQLKGDLLELMTKQYRESEKIIDFDEWRFRMEDNKDVVKKHSEYIELLKREKSTATTSNVIYQINKCLDNTETWGAELNKLSINNIEENNSNGLLCNIDINKLKETILNSNTNQLYLFREFIISLYNQYSINKVKEDKEVLIDLLQFVSENKDKCESKTKRKNMEWLEGNLKKIIYNMKETLMRGKEE